MSERVWEKLVRPSRTQARKKPSPWFHRQHVPRANPKKTNGTIKSAIEAERNRTQWAPSTEESPPGRGTVSARRLREPTANIQNHGEDHRHIQPCARSHSAHSSGDSTGVLSLASRPCWGGDSVPRVGGLGLWVAIRDVKVQFNWKRWRIHKSEFSPWGALLFKVYPGPIHECTLKAFKHIWKSGSDLESVVSQCRKVTVI